MHSRRQFIRNLSFAGAGILMADQALAAAPVDEKDPVAVALGYVADTTRANQSKYPNHTPEQQCNRCQLYQGAPNVATGSGPCPLYAGNLVNATGWCSSFTKRP